MKIVALEEAVCWEGKKQDLEEPEPLGKAVLPSHL